MSYRTLLSLLACGTGTAHLLIQDGNPDRRGTAAITERS
jgi:hypothetical protein